MANRSLQYVIQKIDLTCELVDLQQSNIERYPYLLESTAQAATLSPKIAEQNARFDVLFACPQGHLTLHTEHQITAVNIAIKNNSFLESFNAAWQQEQIQIAHDDILGSFLGWFIYLAYEFSEINEPSLNLPKNDTNTLACATRIPVVIVRDKLKKQVYLLCENKYEHYITKVLHDISACSGVTHTKSTGKLNLVVDEEESTKYIDGIHRIKKYIYEGDVFQVNYSRLWQSDINKLITPSEIYKCLRQANPAPFSGIAYYPSFCIISSSPERLIKVQSNVIQTRPIAGTRPRDIHNDNVLNELIEHPKERAEHIMLIDLERNDLGRVCLPGSVAVTELMVLESFAHVHHIVSNVVGKLKQGILPGDILSVVFPGGTITGCPKVRCMEIIAELEQTPRNAYTGSMGYVSHNGNMDLNILIRTILQKDNKLFIRAGAGIVYDSKPESELDETRAKAKGLIMGLTEQCSQ